MPPPPAAVISAFCWTPSAEVIETFPEPPEATTSASRVNASSPPVAVVPSEMAPPPVFDTDSSTSKLPLVVTFTSPALAETPVRDSDTPPMVRSPELDRPTPPVPPLASKVFTLVSRAPPASTPIPAAAMIWSRLAVKSINSSPLPNSRTLPPAVTMIESPTALTLSTSTSPDWLVNVTLLSAPPASTAIADRVPVVVVIPTCPAVVTAFNTLSDPAPD